MKTIEEKIGYSFIDKTLLETALTHSSYSREKDGLCEHNERLEYLGDAMLDAIIGEELYRMFPKEEEGFLSRTRSYLVCEKSLDAVARKIGIGENIRLSRGEEKTGGRERTSILADAMEAIIGAVFLDGGYDKAKAMVLEVFAEVIEDAGRGKFIITDYKSALQERLQAEGINIETVKYQDAGQEGPDHDKIFTVKLLIDGEEISQGTGKSKKQAQQNAAEQAMARRYNAI